MPVDPRPVPPVYAPEVVAEAILRCAVRPTRDIFAGASAVGIAAGGALAKRLTDKVMERTMFGGQQDDVRGRTREEDNLYAPLDHDGGERGRYDGPVAERSLAPGLSAVRGGGVLGMLALGASVYAGVRALRARRADDASGDVAPGLGAPDYGVERYGGTADDRPVADSAEAAQFTPGGSADVSAGWRPAERERPASESLSVAPPPPQVP
jgi:hypothetical protein